MCCDGRSSERKVGEDVVAARLRVREMTVSAVESVSTGAIEPIRDRPNAAMGSGSGKCSNVTANQTCIENKHRLFGLKRTTYHHLLCPR